MKIILLLCIIAFTVLTALFLYIIRPEWENKDSNQTAKGRIPIAVLGDSDSHIYRDTAPSGQARWRLP